MAQPLDAADGATLPPPVIHEFAPVARELYACDARPALLAGPQGPGIRKAIEEEIEAADAKILSFDVFDTFLLRNDKPETARYLELSRLLQKRVAETKPDRLPDEMDILLARLHALSFSYRTGKQVDGCREGHIAQVARVARNILGLEEDAERLFLEAELDYEAANLKLNPVLAELASNFREKGGKVILVSDMYLGGEEIADIAKRLKANIDFDAIFSSADCIVSKRSGKVFAHIEAKMEAAPKDFLHIGDAWDGDVLRPREAGWRALHFPIARAETVRRRKALDDFLKSMKKEGHDLSRWAQL